MSTQINHIGLTVDDLDTAIAWYTTIFNYRLIAGPLNLVADNSHFGRMATDIFTTRLSKGRFAHLISENSVGIELFEFDDPEGGPRSNTMEFWKNGYFHLCVTYPDIQSMANQIAESGGKLRSQIWEISPGSGQYLIYCEDPWGNVIEIYSHSYAEVWGHHSNT